MRSGWRTAVIRVRSEAKGRNLQPVAAASRILALLACAITSLRAQDTTATTRHLLQLDSSRVRPFHREYDIVTRVGDSSITIGQRDLTLTEAAYASASAWLLVETRTGIVPVAESLYLAPNLRPIHWSSTLGLARLGVEFVGDSILGATTSPTGRRNLLLASKPDLIVSVAMAEVLLSALPLTVQWADSVHILSVDLSSASVQPAYLMVTDEMQPVSDSVGYAQHVTLISGPSETVFTIDSMSRETHLISMSVPRHVGDRLEFRRRQEGAPSREEGRQPDRPPSSFLLPPSG